MQKLFSKAEKIFTGIGNATGRKFPYSSRLKTGKLNQEQYIRLDQICCVNIINRSKKLNNSPSKTKWTIQAVKMPIALHCPYKWYVTFDSSTWDNYSKVQKQLFVAEIVMAVPKFTKD